MWLARRLRSPRRSWLALVSWFHHAPWLARTIRFRHRPWLASLPWFGSVSWLVPLFADVPVVDAGFIPSMLASFRSGRCRHRDVLVQRPDPGSVAPVAERRAAYHAALSWRHHRPALVRRSFAAGDAFPGVVLDAARAAIVGFHRTPAPYHPVSAARVHWPGLSRMCAWPRIAIGYGSGGSTPNVSRYIHPCRCARNIFTAYRFALAWTCAGGSRPREYAA